MEYRDVLGVVTVILAFAVYVPYYITIFQGKTKPHLYTYLIGGIVSLVAFAGALTSGAGAGAWNIGASALLVGGVLILSFRYGTKDIQPVDTLLAVGAGLTIIPWILTDDPTLSVVLASLIDSASMIPTMRKTWHDPHSEPYLVWGLNAVKHTLAIAAVSTVSVATVFYASSMVVMNGSLAAMTFLRQKAQN
ncbi:MAG: hypothetical protein AAB439_01725 [Patescibacteria group bacterium]